MSTLVMVLLCVLLGAFGIGSFVENIKTKQKLHKMQNQEKQNAEIDKKTETTIDTITTGDVVNDIHNGNNILHDLANRS